MRVFEKGDSPPEDDSDSEEDYNTPPESPPDADIDYEENDDPNVPENTDDEISVDEDSEIFHNTAGNDSAIETANLRNFPDLLRIQNSNQETTSDEETTPPSKCTERCRPPSITTNTMSYWCLCSTIRGTNRTLVRVRLRKRINGFPLQSDPK